VCENTYRPAGYCPHCGYPLDPGACPECGRAVPADALDAEPYARPGRRLGALGTVILLAAALVPLAWFGLSRDGPFLHVLSGQVFAGRFDASHVGSVLDQPTIGKWYLIFGVFSAAAVPYLVLIRWISHRHSRSGYWAYVLPTVGVCLCLLIIQTMPFTWLLQYIDAMGFTGRRVFALAYGVGGYLAILGFLGWAARPPRRRRVGRSDGAVPQNSNALACSPGFSRTSVNT
jgi:hypothetical protein